MKIVLSALIAFFLLACSQNEKESVTEATTAVEATASNTKDVSSVEIETKIVEVETNSTEVETNTTEVETNSTEENTTTTSQE